MKTHGFLRKFLGKILIVFLCLMAFVQTSNSVKAAEHNNVITKFEVTTESGQTITAPIKKWEKFRVYGEFVLPNNQINENDTTVLTLPQEIVLAEGPLDFDLLDQDGEIVAHATVSPKRKITLTYTKYVEEHSDVKGRSYRRSKCDNYSHCDRCVGNYAATSKY